MILIGTAGPAGSGKDTVADYLVKHHGFEKMAFAGPLKTMLASVGLAEPADRALKEQLIEGFDFSWRQAAQALGTEWGRSLDPNIWTKLVKLQLDARRQINIAYPDNVRVVLTDVRFENEAALIRNMGGSVWHLVGRKVDLGAQAGHASEGGVMCHIYKDSLLDNQGSLEQLYEQVEATLLKKDTP